MGACNFRTMDDFDLWVIDDEKVCEWYLGEEFIEERKAEDKDYGGACEWWLRTMNSDKKSTAIVYCNGYAEGLEKEHLINYKNRGVRPAIWVKYK